MNNNLMRVTIEQTEVFSIFSSIISIVLGILAIILSIFFYVMSVKAAKETERSSINIENNVKKLEELFDKLYSGTFNMMKDTVNRMSTYVYEKGGLKESSETVLKEIEQKRTEIIEESVKQIKASQKTDDELEVLIKDILVKSVGVVEKVNKEHISEGIIAYLKKKSKATYPELRKYLESQGLLIGTKDTPTIYLFKQLEELYENDTIKNPFDLDPTGTGDRVIYDHTKIELN